MDTKNPEQKVKQTSTKNTKELVIKRSGRQSVGPPASGLFSPAFMLRRPADEPTTTVINKKFADKK